MASFYETTVGQQVEFQRVLAAAGFTQEGVLRINGAPDLASKMHEAIQPPRAVVTVGTPSWWRTPEQQLERARPALVRHRSARAAQGVRAPHERRGSAPACAGRLQLPVEQGRCP